MAFLRITVALFCFLSAFQLSYAQDLSRLRIKTVAAEGDTLRLDSLSIVANSLIIKDVEGNSISASSYEFDPVKSVLIWKTKPASDSINVVYRTFPFSLSKAMFRKDAAKIEQTEDFIVNPFAYVPPTESASFIDFGTLDYNGSFARGLSFGNNQDVTLTSNFNLQLSGNITKDIEIVAALTDNNIPIQPDGTTQQLQEFDKVFIKITKKPHTLIVGDYEIASPEGYFMKYYKKLQGASYTGTFQISEKEKAFAQANLAVTRGLYNRYRIPVTEGNQGPYKLIGANGETYIIVLAGTERVFINGKLMERGSDRDYVIDYNLGEIIFTPNVLITQDLRVEVEFEYSQQSYFRSTFAINGGYEREKVKFRVNLFSEQDSKNQPTDDDLTGEQKGVLENAGDNPFGSLVPGYRFEEYSEDRILYALIDGDTANIEFDTVFVYSTDPDSAKYVVNFTPVGQGRGDYVRAQTSANGVVYEWLAPVNGVPQGAYIPFRVLIAPNRKQMATLGMDLKPTENDLITMEAAVSNTDLNTFSSFDDDNNVGFAAKGGYQRKFSFGEKSKGQQFTADANYEFVNHNFSAIERFRTVEFNRDWNYLKRDTTDEHIVNGGLKYTKQEWFNAGYQFSSFLAGDTYTGYQHRFLSAFNHKGYLVNADIRYLTSEALTENSTFIRPTVEVARTFANLNGWKIGGRYEQEINRLRSVSTDTLLRSSFTYNDWRVYIANADTAQDKLRFEYVRRLEFSPSNNDLRLNNSSNTVNFKGNWLTNKTHKLGWQFTYRMFETNDTVLQKKELEHYYLSRIEYGLTLFKGAITTNVLYELGAGKEPRIDYAYIEVNPGEGNFIWNSEYDYNGDSILQKNEVELATFSDGNYIRVLVPTDKYDAVDMTQFNQSLGLNPRAIWGGKKGIKGFIARFSTITSLQVERKVLRGEGKSPFNPFVFSETDSSLVSLGSLARNSVFFNRSDPKYSLEYTFQDNRRKVNQVSGVETTSLREHVGRLRLNIIQPLNFLFAYTYGERGAQSQFYPERNYLIKSHEAEPQFSYLLGTKFRVTLLYNFSYRKNSFSENGNPETAYSNEATAEARYNVVSKSTLTAKFSFVKIDYTGSENTAIEFAMLQGFKDGNNYTWTASYERNLAKAIQLSLVYDGRKTGDSKAVHVGRVQVRAIF